MKQFRHTHYKVDEYGNVYGRKKGGAEVKMKGRILKGYKSYILRMEYGRCKTQNFLAHRLVAELYLDNFDPNLTVNHKDFNKLNNHYTNLEMMTASENVKDYHIRFRGDAFREYNKNKKGKTYYELYPDKAERLIEEKREQGKKNNYLHNGNHKYN